ncbi:MAG: mercury methylation corrinoid protein HgcA [Ignavibacteria bacterium]|nr:mercury methylation corrinoid protein HgcA [Ignavibacteria bacterium]
MNNNVDYNREKIIRQTNSLLTFANRWDHFLKRLGINRGKNRIKPGLYSLGNPNSKSQIFVSANYTLSFDALRTALGGTDCYILVLDTKGINVWCAAGKGTFGTNELVRQIKLTGLRDVTERRRLILPQLSGPGVAAQQVKKLSGFNVEYGPVRANDLPEYLKTHKATPEMRRVKFNLGDRLILVPTELTQATILIIILAVPLYFIGGLLPVLAIAAAFLAGVVLFPILLPWIPTPHFSTKGFILGALIALPFAIIEFFGKHGIVLWQRGGWALSYILILTPVTAYLSLNFTGATTFTSRSGVKREIFAYIPKMAWMLGGGIVLSVTFILINLLGT